MSGAGVGALVAVVLLGAAQAGAQPQAGAYQAPNLKTELFAGFSTVRLAPGRGLDPATLNGWTASVTSYHVFARWGLAAEIGGNGGDAARQRAYLFGGTYRGLQRKRFALTGRILAGSTVWRPKAAGEAIFREQRGLTFGLGQALDVKFSEQWMLRVQPDLRFIRFEDERRRSRFRLAQPLSVGMVYQFGRR